ncbi:hypothetical protein [Fusibacter ferrireducens]|uniref:Uncharacterized protein n=1 Tax=Fusibacter ferrireducens TaxID=2785058 RepID=A0ABS0A034_9FIRM|nr:hypothetical protein [Fusibacter ferrireducens]MBF4696062.1 hypothetical protein [Fusibacter ferrireducens]
MTTKELKVHLYKIVSTELKRNNINNEYVCEKFFEHVFFEITYKYFLDNEETFSLRNHTQNTVEENRYRGINKLYNNTRQYQDTHAISAGGGGSLYADHNIKLNHMNNISEKVEGHNISSMDYNQLLKNDKYSLFIQIRKNRLFNNRKVKNEELIEYYSQLELIYNDFDLLENKFERCIEYYQLELQCCLERIYRIGEFLSINEGINNIESYVFLLLVYSNIFYGQFRFLNLFEYYLNRIEDKNSLIEIVFLHKIRKSIMDKIFKHFVENNMKLEIDTNLEAWNLYRRESIVNDKIWYGDKDKINLKLFRNMRKIKENLDLVP